MKLINSPLAKTLILFCLLSLVKIAAYTQTRELDELHRKLMLSKDSLTTLRLLNDIGFMIHMKSADSAFYYGVEASRLAEKLKDKKGKADATANLAIGLALKGLYSESLSYYSLAYLQYKDIPDTMEMANMLMNSSITYSFTADSVKAKEFARRAFYLARNLKPDSALSMLYANYVEMADLPKIAAEGYLNRAITLAIRFKNDRSLLYIWQLQAQQFLTDKKYAQSRYLIQKSLELAKKHQWDYHELEAMGLYGNYYSAIGQTDSALNEYREIYHIAGTNGFNYWKIDVLRSMLQIYESRDDLGGQAATNKLLVEALDHQNEDNKDFMGDYLKFNEDRDQLMKFRQTVVFQRKEQWAFVIASLAGLLCTIIILLAYRRSRNQKKDMQRLIKKISTQNLALQANDDFNSRLLSMLAHDFSAPLGQTLGMISILRDEEMNRETLMRFYGKAETDIQNILITFDNILHWVKRQLSGYEPVQEILNLSEMIELSAAMFRQAMTEKELILNNLLDPEQTFSGDREIIQFINRNLIHNAIKYSPQNSIITINANLKSGEIIVSIRNEGEGMTQEQLDQLFTFRQQESFDRGAGMALTLSREFITLIGGRIWAESDQQNGTTFYYALPLSLSVKEHLNYIKKTSIKGYSDN